MKIFYFLLLTFLPFFGVAQVTTADPALEPMKITTLNNTDITVMQIPQNSILILKVPILNKNLINLLPGGSCKIKIGLGSKIILDPSFNLNTVNTSNYFNWTSINAGGEVQITGDLFAPLPTNFNDTAFFNIKGIILGNSTVRTNFLVTNHNTNTILSDEDGANNTASFSYTIIAPSSLPLTLINFNAVVDNCTNKLRWASENETNTNYFSIEKSVNGIDWFKIGTINAQGNSIIRLNYSFIDNDVQSVQGKFLYRLKMVDKDNSFKYSDVIMVLNNCQKLQMIIYPNPVINNSINFSISGFSKNIISVLKSVSGEIISIKNCANGSNLLDVTKLANGIYILTVSDKDGNTKQQKVVLQK